MEAAFFDLDKTVIAKPSMVAFGRPLYDAGIISRWLVLRALWSNLVFHYLGADEERMRAFKEKALRITAGWDQALVSSIVRDTLADVIDPLVYDEALELVREHQQAGRRVFLVSASPEEIVAPLAKYLGVDEAIASRAELDDEGRYTGDVEFWSYGPYKAVALVEAADRHGIDLTASYAYSDSGTDIPMLEAVGHPVAVNPDRDLTRVALERGWEIRHFSNSVPLRERVSMPPRGRVLAVVGVASATAGAAAVLTWALTRRSRSPASGPSLRAPRQLLHARRPAARAGRATTARSGLRPVVRVRRPAASSPRGRRGRGRRGSRSASSWRRV